MPVETFNQLFTDFFSYILIIMGVSFVLFLLIIGIAVRQLRKVEIPPDASFTETLRLAPFTIVLAIDLLDLSLDFLAVPIVWVMLNKLGLKALREVSAVEALVPGTQLIPTLTLSWIGVRVLGVGYYEPREKQPTS